MIILAIIVNLVMLDILVVVVCAKTFAGLCQDAGVSPRDEEGRR